jgi:hypothetical protein
MKTKTDESEKFDKLIDGVTDKLVGESLNIVIPALTMLLANAGVMSKTDYVKFITYVMETITEIYNKHATEEFEVNVSEHTIH